MRVYLKNIRAKFHLDPVWNDGAFGNFEERRPNKNKSNNKKNKNKASKDQFLILKPMSIKNPKQSSVAVQKCLIRAVFVIFLLGARGSGQRHLILRFQS